MPYNYEWLSIVVDELCSFGFYVVTGYLFRPTRNSTYEQISMEDDFNLDDHGNDLELTESEHDIDFDDFDDTEAKKS